ncbi:hypothetical protein ACSHWB_41600 [Lentzea sp. HUAS TT2]|uniref:hypothetical protein n=1 Tax=Lentzea sp. HUAS TT2 TaxID=3447454 RepID=UPI003F71A36A
MRVHDTVREEALGRLIMLMSFLWRVPNNDAGVAQGRRLISAVFTGLPAAPKPL